MQVRSLRLLGQGNVMTCSWLMKIRLPACWRIEAIRLLHKDALPHALLYQKRSPDAPCMFACRTAPPAPPPGSVPPTAAAARGAVCGAEVTVATPGSDGAGGYTASVMVTASNLGNATIPAPWTLAIANPAYTGVSQARGAW